MASSPVEDQSAHVTFSATWRGFPPDSGTTARVPLTAKPNHSARNQTASSPLAETPKRAHRGGPVAGRPGFPMLVNKRQAAAHPMPR